MLASVVTLTGDFFKGIGSLEKVVSHHAEGEAYDHAKHFREQIIPAMTALRATADKLEAIIPDDIWPLPTYREMLFIK